MIRNNRVFLALLVAIFALIGWLAFFSEPPLFYSYNEMDRATAACQGHSDMDYCVAEQLTKWRKEHPDARRGSYDTSGDFIARHFPCTQHPDWRHCLHLD